MVKTIVITQARVGSSRFPEKVLQPLGESTLLGVHLQRLKQAKRVSQIIVATTFEEKSGEILEIARQENLPAFQGSTTDVLDRFYQAAVAHQPDYVVRVTSDCPLIDPQLLDEVINMVQSHDVDYGSNILIEHFPDGQDIEVFRFNALERAWKEAKLSSEREHVTPYIIKNSDIRGGTLFRAINYGAPANYNHIRMTVDEPSDLDTIQYLIAKLGQDRPWLEYTNYILEHQNVFGNQDILRNEGYLKSIQNDI